MANEPTSMTTDVGGDISEVARRTLNYLMEHQPIVTVRFPEDHPPSEEMLRLLAPHVVGMEGEMAVLVGRFLSESIASRLGLKGIEID